MAQAASRSLTTACRCSPGAAGRLPSAWERPHQHWRAKRAAAQARLSSGVPRRPTRATSLSLGNGKMLSKFATHRRARPCAGPSGTSVGISLTRVVTGATRIVLSRGRTELRVSTTTGRRLLPGTSANQTSPRSGCGAPGIIPRLPREGRPKPPGRRHPLSHQIEGPGRSPPCELVPVRLL